jgi:hypothetical protein
MMISRALLTATIILIASLVTVANADEPKLPKWVIDSAKWQPPPEGVVRGEWAAIEIAHAVWFSLNRARPVPDVKLWQKNMRATLKSGVWQVTTPMPANMVGGSLFVFISQRDGRIMNVFMTQ